VTRRRLDAELVRRGLASSREEARAAVRRGLVSVGGSAATVPASMVAPEDAIRITPPARRFVSRGGDKLDAALDRFGVEPGGLRCMDAGASTGGFTDCLLRRGALHVAAVDVGYGQLAWALRSDPRVTVLERTNVRELTREAMPYAAELVVADLSFISLALVAPALEGLSTSDATYIALVKPQFEAARADVGAGGVVRDPSVWLGSLASVRDAFGACGVGTVGVMASPLRGPAGNVEFFLHARGGMAALPLDFADAVAEGEAVRDGSPAAAEPGMSGSP
jgi:23S rRNA (cytidine1920-2'-O)/16S rRNA (cytidine1409-2'-O)-methyltransferase